MDPTPPKSEDKFVVCNLEICANERFEYVHRLPANNFRRRKWVDAITLAGANAHKVRRICARHFLPGDYIHPESRFLNRIAVPSLNFTDLSQLDKCRQIVTMPAPATDSEFEQKCGENYSANNNLKRTATATEQHCDSATGCKKIKVQNGSVEEQSKEATVADYTVDESNMFLTMEDVEETQTFTSVAYDVVNNVNNNNGVQQQPQQEEETNHVIVQIEQLQETNEKVSESANESLIKIDEHQLVVQHLDYEEALEFDFNWLRDFCKCEECFNSTTGMRKQNVLAHPLDLQPEVATLTEDNLVVEWNNGHTSTYSLVDIYLTQDSTNLSNQIPWTAKHANFRDDFTPINFNDLICSASIEITALERLQRSGVLLIAGLSTDTKQQPLMIELLLRRLFPHNYQRLVHEQRTDFSNAPHQQPHTNCTFLSESCGLQILSLCPATNTATTAVKFTCLDGLNTAIQLRSMARQSFDCLTNFKLQFVYRNVEEKFDFSTEATVIEVLSDASVKRVQYAPYQRGVMPQQNFAKFTEALRKFAKIMENEKNHWTFNLRNDMLIILDNWRICWQLKAENVSAATKSNVALNCIYVERKQLLSRLNRLEIGR